MDWLCWIVEGLFRWEAVTAIATVGGALAVGLQLFWLRRQIDLQSYADYTKRYQEIVLKFPENINESTFQLKKLRKEDRDQTMRYMRAYFDLCFEEWNLNKRDLIDQDTWKIWRSGMEFAFTKSSFRQAWETIRADSQFGKEFEDFVAAAMSKI